MDLVKTTAYVLPCPTLLARGRICSPSVRNPLSTSPTIKPANLRKYIVHTLDFRAVYCEDLRLCSRVRKGGSLYNTV